MTKSGDHTRKKLEALLDLFEGLALNRPGKELYLKHKWAIDEVNPADVIDVVDQLVQKEIPMDQMKTGISKALNLLYQALSALPVPEPVSGGFLHALMENNKVLDDKLKGLRPLIKEINQQPDNVRILESLKEKVQDINQYPVVYQIKENLLFPILEKYWDDFRCVQVMWSIHDDIRRNLKELLDLLEISIVNKGLPEENNLNTLLGDLFFAMYTIKFREERILIPVILDTTGEVVLNETYQSTTDLTFPHHNPRKSIVIPAEAGTPSRPTETTFKLPTIDLPTGALSPTTLNLLFNHLPIDITYVDAEDKVQFFSDPPHRIFPRTRAVIGRKVQNCHPPESMDAVNKILKSFKSGEKDLEEFWIDFRGRKIQISYYALRNEQKEYMGVLEVSQDITELQKRTGEKRLVNE
ncbi:MAG: PAS domain-containing protein [Bacteroidota bacterium]|nr:PAS domain-containing protein [Bacteroidota bacterium]